MSLIHHLNLQLLERETRGLRRSRRVAESPCTPQQRFSHHGLAGCDPVSFCSNDYLGLANHPALIEALVEGAQRYGAGSGASHLISGHSRAHAQFEDELSAWMATCIPGAKALGFCTGYMANMALLTALGDANATIFSDDFNHASIIDGARLAKAQVQRYPHRDIAMLEDQLKRAASPIKLIVTDAVFSMDGDLADLPGLLELCERFDAWLVVDDAHGFGVLGPHGQGSLGHFGLCSERLIYMGTLGKAAGVGGAFVAAHPSVIDWLVQTARPYIYTTASPPALAHALRMSLRLVGSEEGDERRASLQWLVRLLRAQLQCMVDANPGLGWVLPASETAIQPLIVGANETALALATALEARGLRVPAIRPPTVPAGTSRLRITLSASHTPRDVQRLVDGLTHAARELLESPP